MPTYQTLDFLPDLTLSQRTAARLLNYESMPANTRGADYIAYEANNLGGVQSRSILKFQGTAGAKYWIWSWSSLDPAGLTVYDLDGNALVTNDERSDPATSGVSVYDYINAWTAPYSGVYYVDAAWRQGAASLWHGVEIDEDRNPPNSPPTASDLRLSTSEEQRLVEQLIGASDPDGDPLIYATSAGFSHGTVGLSSTGLLSYLPDRNFNGADLMDFSVSDGRGGIVTRRITIDVLPVQDPPALVTALSDKTTTTGTALAFTLAANAFQDPDGGQLAWSAALADGRSLPAWLSFAPDTRSFSGTPGSKDTGTLTVRVTVSDSTDAATDDFDIVISASAGTQKVTGTAANDVLFGGSGHDEITGLAGNDTLSGRGGDDLIDGGQGLDTALFNSGRGANRASLVTADRIIISGPEGQDTLIGVERAVFNDGAWGFDVEGTGGKGYRLYQAAFNRVPDEGGLGFWIASLDAGLPLNAAAGFFIGSAEFGALYGKNIPNNEFTGLLYQNVLHRLPDQGGYDFWNNALNGTGGFERALPRAEVLAQFSESPENKANVIGVIGDGFEYIPYVAQ